MLLLCMRKTFFAKYWNPPASQRGSDPLPTKGGQRVTCSLPKTKFLGQLFRAAFLSSGFASFLSLSWCLFFNSLQGMESCTRIACSTFLIFFWALFAQPSTWLDRRVPPQGQAGCPSLEHASGSWLCTCASQAAYQQCGSLGAHSLKGPCWRIFPKSNNCGSQQRKGSEHAPPQGTDRSLQKSIETKSKSTRNAKEIASRIGCEKKSDGLGFKTQ